VQCKLNELYWGQIGLTAPNGLWERKSHKNLIKACQIEWGVTADGIFGNGTMNAAPTLSRNTSGRTASKRLLQCALAVNGFWPGGLTGTFGDGTYQAVYSFQDFLCLGADGIAGKNTWASLLKSSGNTARSATACDTSTRLTATTAQALITAGYGTVGRYLTNAGEGSGFLDKKMTVEEIGIMANVGLKVFPIYQTIGSSADNFTWLQGATAAIAARDAAKSFGFPASTVIYFAVDYDVLTADITSNILPYFRGIKWYLGNSYQIGVYGPRSVCIALDNAGLTTRSFVSDMSSGFTGNIGQKMPSNWAYDQFAEITVGGIGIDKCIASPRATAILASALDPVPVYCGGDDYRNVQNHDLVLGVDGIYRCSVCGYEVVSPTLQDRDILSELDYQRVVALLHAFAYYESLRLGNASIMFEITPEEDTGVEFYYMPEKCLRTIDIIRGSAAYRESYNHCDSNGYYYPELAEAYTILANNNYNDIFVSSANISDIIMLGYYNGSLEALYELAVSVFASYYCPVFWAVTQGIVGALEVDAATFLGGCIDYIVEKGLAPASRIPYLKLLSNLISLYQVVVATDFSLAVGDGIVEIKPMYYPDNSMNVNVFFDANNNLKLVESEIPE